MNLSVIFRPARAEKQSSVLDLLAASFRKIRFTVSTDLGASEKEQKRKKKTKRERVSNRKIKTNVT